MEGVPLSSPIEKVGNDIAVFAGHFTRTERIDEAGVDNREVVEVEENS
jgi:hypothetical protein